MAPEEHKETDNKTLYRLYLGFSRRLGFFIRHLPSPLGTNASHIMAEIYDAGAISAKEIAAELSIEKSVLSRILKALEARQLVEWSASGRDRRWKELRLTDLGRKLLEEDCAVRNQQTALAVAGLSPSDIETLRLGQKNIADALNTPQVGATLGDNPLEREIRRITRAFNFLGRDFMQTGLPAERCQVLLLIGSHADGLPMVELKQELAYDGSVLSRLLSGMTEEGLVEKVVRHRDHRQIRLKLTAQGQALNLQAMENGGTFVKSALAKLDPAHNARLSAVMAKVVELPKDLPHLDEGKFHISALPDGEPRFAARAFVVEELVRSHHHYHLPENLLASKSVCHAAYSGEVLKGVVEAQRHGSNWRLATFVVAHERDAAKLSRLLLQSCLQQVFEEKEARAILITSDSHAAEMLRELGFNGGKRGGFSLTKGDMVHLVGIA